MTVCDHILKVTPSPAPYTQPSSQHPPHSHPFLILLCNLAIQRNGFHIWLCQVTQKERSIIATQQTWEISNPNTNRGWNLSHFVIVFLWMGLNLQTFFEMGSKTQESHEVLKRSLPHSLLEVCLFQIEFMLQSTNAIKKLEAIAL